MSAASGAAAGILLVIVGIWLLLQTLVGGLVSRVVGTFSASSSSSSSTQTPAQQAATDKSIATVLNPVPTQTSAPRLAPLPAGSTSSSSTDASIGAVLNPLGAGS